MGTLHYVELVMQRVFDSTASIRFPAWPCVKIELERIKNEFLAAGDMASYERCVQRYDGLTYKDIEIEKIALMSDGRLKVCIIVRNRGFARYDLRIHPITLRQVLDCYELEVVEFESPADLRNELASESRLGLAEVCYNKWNDTFGVIVPTQAQINVIPDVLGGIRFDKIIANVEDYDNDVMTSGFMTVVDRAIGSQDVLLYIRDQYKPEQPDGDDFTVRRSAMVMGLTTITFTVGKKLPDITWDVKLTHPSFDAGELVIAPDKQSATMELRLKKARYTGGKQEIKGTATINGAGFPVDVGFQHNPPVMGSYSGGNHNVWTTMEAEIGFWGGVQAKDLIISDGMDIKYTEAGQEHSLNIPFTRRSNSGSYLKVFGTFPGFNEEGDFDYWFMVDSQEGDSTNWVESTGSRYLPMPDGATGIIAIPEEIIKTDVEYVFTAKVKVTFNDEARTPVTGSISYDPTIVTNGKPGERFNIKQTPDGYELKYTGLESVDVTDIELLCKVTAYSYSGFPKTYFEHRYGYTGPEGVVVDWQRMERSNKRGVFKYINANGVTDTEKVWKKINMMDGIWSTMSEFRNVSGGVGVYCDLDMHIVDYNRPKAGLTRLTFSLDGVQQDIDVQFEYNPVELESVTGKYNAETNQMEWTIKLPESGITSDKLIVERDYSYGNASLTTGWIRNKTDVDEKTSTFTTNVGWENETYYRIYFSNLDDLTSVYFWTGTISHS
uniref:Tail protein n=1 Tax=Pantoea phage Survivor TaxID=3232176 RepID=A0AAU8KYE5_9CAUD